ncbi:MAG TPA: lasso RiPP family leader peptide-containing protein [Gaiellaceae bacterium]|nr:lasso RiPP family leader peptide-containing protein [Gaiellaceae bacterium]
MEDRREPQEYEAPAVIDYGDLNDLTGGSKDGDFTDAAFPTDTPKSKLTFSTH